jgi:actin-like ATPase involved in cell morphogenesis
MMGNKDCIKEIIERLPCVVEVVVSEQKADGWHYKRLIGRTITNYVITDSPLLEGEINQFRTKPAAFVELFTVPTSKEGQK